MCQPRFTDWWDDQGLTAAHPGYAVVGVLAPLATWWVLQLPIKDGFASFDADQLAPGLVTAQLAAAAVADLLP